MTTPDHCLDPALALPALQSVMPGARGVRVLASRRSASRRRNPHPLTLRYEIDLPEGPRAFYGKVYREGASAAAHPGAPVLHVPALDLLLWPWPADPGLPQLEAMLDPRCAPVHGGLAAASVEVLRHEPEVRALLVYTLAGPEAAPPLYAKTFAQPRAVALARRYAHLAAHAARDPDAPGVAETLGVDASGHTLWQRQAPSAAFEPQQLAPTPTRSLALARALAAVHRAPHDLAGPQARDAAHWLRELARRHKKLGRVAPECAPQLEALRAVLEAGADHLAAGPLVPIHGDCHPGQYRWQGERVLVFDLDEMCLGDPMEDLAECLVSLERDGDPLGWAGSLQQAYAQLEPTLHDAKRLSWHRAMQHLLQAARSFVFQAPDWRARAAAQLQRALAAAAPLRTG